MTKLYDIYNPTPARRIIFNGIGKAGGERVEIQPKQTVNGIALADHIVERIQEAAQKMEEGEEIQLTEVGEVEDQTDEDESTEEEEEADEAAPPVRQARPARGSRRR